MQLNHYINFQGQTEAAFNFYKSVFGGEFSFIKRYSELADTNIPDLEKNYILHISLPINDSTVLMASDVIDHFCTQMQTPFIQGNNHYISINLEANDVNKAQSLFDALSVNGKIEAPLEKTFWGAIFGSFTDQFGIQWMINCQLE